MLDTVRSVETPEGVELRLRVAGPAPRLMAWLVDLLVRAGIVMAVTIPLGILGKAGTGVFFLVLFLVEWFYPVFFELRSGATPGKRSMGLLVLEDDGVPVGATASLLRNLLRFADFLPFAFGFGLASMLVTRDFKRLGDLAAGTVVVHKERLPAAPQVPPAKPSPPPVPLTLEEQRAVLDFAERLPTWTHERAVELGSLAEPLTSGVEPEVLPRLLGIASWIVGRR